MNRYDLPIPRLRYMCTVDLSRKYIPSTNHELNTSCELLGIELYHHRSDSDTNACMEIFMHINSLVELNESHIKEFRQKDNNTFVFYYLSISFN